MSRSLLLVISIIAVLLSACASARAEEPVSTDIPEQVTAAVESTQVIVPSLEASPNPAAATAEPVDMANSAQLSSALLASALVVDGGGEYEPLLYPLNPVSGEALSGFEPLPLGLHYAYAFSPDGRMLALVTFLSSEFTRPHALIFLDLETWQTEEFDLKIDSYVQNLQFSPDGRKLAIHFGEVKSIVMIFDRQLGEVTDEVTLDFLASRLKYTGDGSGLMLYGTTLVNRFTAEEKTDGAPTVALLDADDLSQRWMAQLEGVRDGIYPKDETDPGAADLHQPGAAIYYSPGLAFAAGGDILYVVHPDQDRLTRVDFSAQQVETLEIRTKLSWFERLLTLGGGIAHAKVAEGTSRQAVVSPDGEFLYVVGEKNDLHTEKSGDWQVRSTPLGLQAIRLADGVRLAQVETEAVQLSISSDGGTLYLYGWDEQLPWTEVMDTAEMEITARLEGMRLTPGSWMNSDGLLLSGEWIEGSGYHMAVVDRDTLKVISQWKSSRPLLWIGPR